MDTKRSIASIVLIIKLTVYAEDTDISRIRNQIEGYGVFFTLNSTLECYKDYYRLPVVQAILREVAERYPDAGLADNPEKSHPFIAVEGVHRKTRNIVALFLARKMGGDIVYNPPLFMAQLGRNFTDSTLRKAFFGLAGYAAASSARHLTKTVPAIVAGHWLSQMAFALSKIYERLPPAGDPIYTWPRDLYMPDLIFFLNTQRKPREKYKEATPPPDPSFLPKFIDVFRTWRNPRVIEINNTYLYEDIANQMLTVINKELQGNYR